MAETIAAHHGASQWNWASVVDDLKRQGGLKDIFIDPLSMDAHSCGGTFKKKRFCITWIKDTFLLLSMEEFSQELVDAFATVVEYQPFCQYTEPNGLVTVEWDKNDPESRFRDLEQKGYPDLQRLTQGGIQGADSALDGQEVGSLARPLGFSVAPGVGAALANRGDDRAYFVFEGDLNQMGIIYARLLWAGFRVVKSDVYPGFPRDQEEEYIKALRFLFDNRVEGWWNQERDLVRYEICTQGEFDKALGRTPQ